MNSIEEKAEKYFKDNYTKDDYLSHFDIEDAYIAGAREVSNREWTSVKEKLPEHGDLVIVKDRFKYIYAAKYDKIYNEFESLETQETIDFIDSWMLIF